MNLISGKSIYNPFGYNFTIGFCKGLGGEFKQKNNDFYIGISHIFNAV